MFASVRRAVEGATLTVLVTHWWEYFRDDRIDTEFIAILHEVAAWLASRPDVQVVSFDQVAAGAVPISRAAPIPRRSPVRPLPPVAS